MAALTAQNKHLMEQLSRMTATGLTREEPVKAEDTTMAGQRQTSDLPLQDQDITDKGEAVEEEATTEALVIAAEVDRMDVDGPAALRGGGTPESQVSCSH